MDGNDRKLFLLKEIDLVQDVIKRMASNSFLLKGWAVTLVIATLLLREKPQQIWISFIPLISFWFLDAYFLRLERMYQKLYAWIVINRLKTDEFLFDLNAYRFNKEVQSIFRTMFSITLIWFYGIVIILILIIWLITLNGSIESYMTYPKKPFHLKPWKVI